MNTIRREIHPHTIKVLDAKQGLVEYTASDETLDSYREIIKSDGWMFDHFQKNAPFVDSHNYGSIDCCLGRVVDYGVKKKALVETVKWAVDVPDNILAQKGFAMTEAGYLKAVSVGFQPVKMVSPYDRHLEDYEDAMAEMGLDPRKDRVNCIYLKQQQKELSACLIGANPNAVARAYKDGVLTDGDLDLFSKHYAAGRKFDPARDSESPAHGPASAEDSRKRARSALLASYCYAISSI